MFSIGIRYLSGTAVATHPASREQAEWPPHPDRVFMALAAAHYETDGPAAEVAAMEWLEQQPPPALHVSEAHARTTVTTFVPVNDARLPAMRGGKALSDDQVATGLRVLPERRSRQPRQFPTVVPHDPVVHLTWPDIDAPPEYRSALTALCRKVTCIGHSSSLVQAWVADESPPPSLVPTTGVARHRLRVTRPGRLRHLAERFAAQQRPAAAPSIGYHPPLPPAVADTVPATVFGSVILLRRVEGRRLGLETTLALAAALRAAAMKSAGNDPPEWVTGHALDGTPSRLAHLAFFPLPHVGHDHADGHLLGVGMAIPRHVDAPEVQRCLELVIGYAPTGEPRQTRLYQGKLFDWVVEPEVRPDPPTALRHEVWTAAPPAQPARRWASVTPIVLDRYPKGEGDAEAILATACERIGLPRPRDIVISQVSLFLGAPHARQFPPVEHGQANRYHCHAVLSFDAPVRGPLLLGAGRFRGYGLCRPLREGGM